MFKPLKEANANRNDNSVSANILRRVVRGPAYLFSFILLFCTTVMIFVAYFTSNWEKTLTQVSNKGESYTNGLWFTCRHVQISWIKGQSDVFCSTLDFASTPWIHAALLNLFSFFATVFGLCKDYGKEKLGMPSLILWVLIASSCSQLIALCIYGGKGIGNYTYYEPDYSIIIAAVALGVNFLCCALFLIEIITKRTTQKV